MSGTESFDTRKYYPISFIVLSFFALLLYIFVILLMLRNKKLRRKPANKFLLNLLISDGIVCISFMSYAGYLLEILDDERFFESFLQRYFLLQSFIIVINIVVFLSMINFTLITVDRLIAVKWPFFYIYKIDTKQSLIAIAVVWGITTIYAIVMITLFSVLNVKTSIYLEDVTFVAVVITGFILLFVSNSFVFVEARKHLRRREIITLRLTNIAIEPSNRLNNEEKEFRKKDFRLMRINVGLILCFFLFWINILIVNIKLLVYADEVQPPMSKEYILASWYLIQIYYIFNPLWYVTLSHDVKREVKRFFKWEIG